MKKSLLTLLAILSVTGFASIAFALPFYTSQQSILPFSDNKYNIGTTSPANLRFNGFFNNLTVGGTCTGCGGGGGASINTNPLSEGYTVASSSATSTFSGGIEAPGFGSPWFSATSTTATSTFSFGLNVGQVNTTGTATSTFTNGLWITGGALTLNSPLTIANGGTNDSSLTGNQILYTNNAGTQVMSAASSSLALPNTALANSTISGIALGNNLNSLTKSGTTLNGSSYNGSAAISDWSINLGNANTWTGTQLFSFTATTTHSSGVEAPYFGAQYYTATSTSATSTLPNLNVGTMLLIPNSTAAPVFGVTGALAIETKTASSGLAYYDGTAIRTIYATQEHSFVFASSTLVYDGAFGAAGSTTLMLANYATPVTLLGIYCRTDIGTAWIGFGTGSATTSEAKCATTGTFVPLTTSNTWTQRQNFFIEIGTSATAPNFITVTADVRPDSN